MGYRIVMDSCGELPEELKKDPHFVLVPLTLHVGEHTIVDDDTFDQADFLVKVAACPECPKSACPSPELYMEASTFENPRSILIEPEKTGDSLLSPDVLTL